MSTRQRWVPVVAYTGTLLVAGMTIVVSGMWLTRLNGMIGMDGPLAVSLPITVDAGGAVGTVVWLTGPTRDARTWGRSVAVGALASSIVGNILAHLITLGELSVSAPLVVGVSAVYPVMCWLMVHLLVLLRGPARMASGKPAKPAKPAGAPSRASAPAAPAPNPAPAPVPATPTEDASEPAAPVALHVVEQPSSSKREQGKQWFNQQVAAGRDPGDIRPAEVDKAIGATSYAKKFIADWRAETHPAEPEPETCEVAHV